MNKAQISKIYREFKVPQGLINHMKAVSLVAEKIAINLNTDQKFIVQAALLHDVLRMVDMSDEVLQKLSEGDSKKYNFWLILKKKYHKIGHERGMSRYLNSINEKKLAKIIKHHGFFDIDKLKTLEEKILYYADKRVDFDKIVTLKKRFAEGKKRNMRPTDNPQLIKSTEAKIFQLEKELGQNSKPNSKTMYL
ncbi:MAG: HD domain-containing protein [Patescibacteria group bacterium]